MAVQKFTYGGDPAASPRDAVRFLVGDTDPKTAQLEDDEIDYALEQTGGVSARLAAAFCFEALAGRYAFKADVSVGEVSRSFSKIADALQKRADNMRAQEGKLAVPFWGGLSKSGKAAFASDPDLVQPAFRRRQADAPEVTQLDDVAIDEDTSS